MDMLQDGRIIDGNRRFTALRQLQAEAGTSQYFEAVILPFTYDAKADRAQIKRLELAIQMGTEENFNMTLWIWRSIFIRRSLQTN